MDKKIEAKCRSKLEGGSFEREMEKDREKNNPKFFLNIKTQIDVANMQFSVHWGIFVISLTKKFTMIYLKASIFLLYKLICITSKI